MLFRLITNNILVFKNKIPISVYSSNISRFTAFLKEP